MAPGHQQGCGGDTISISQNVPNTPGLISCQQLVSAVLLFFPECLAFWPRSWRG